jgi:Tn3 transposase DDE domain
MEVRAPTAFGFNGLRVQEFANPRAFRRGVLIYWSVEKGSVVIHSQLLNCSASEVHAMVDGAIHHGTEMAVEANYVDSHGQSEIGFGVTKLLGFDLLPRIKRINKVKMYRPAAGEPDLWPQLKPALTRPITGGGRVFRPCTIPPIARLSAPALQRGPRGSRPSRVGRA